MLVYPLDLHYDQNGNGLKVEYHGLGLRGVFQFERSADMKGKMEELLEKPEYTENIKILRNNAMSNQFAKADLLALIEQVTFCEPILLEG